MDGTRWGWTPNQQLIDRRMALAKLAAVLAKMHDFQRADSAYAAWKAVTYEGNHTRDYFIENTVGSAVHLTLMTHAPFALCVFPCFFSEKLFGLVSYFMYLCSTYYFIFFTN